MFHKVSGGLHSEHAWNCKFQSFERIFFKMTDYNVLKKI